MGTLTALPPVDLSDVPGWRRATRAVLLARRMAMPADARAAADARISAQLAARLAQVHGPLAFYWPMRGEFDPRPVVTTWLAAKVGRKAALPVVLEKHAPLVFYAWQPEEPMVAGVFGTTIPKSARVLVPQTLLIPLVGFDAAQFRLGYGGGYYDRTLAALVAGRSTARLSALSAPSEAASNSSKKITEKNHLRAIPYTIGIGYESGRLATVVPQAHDFMMKVIVTERVFP